LDDDLAQTEDGDFVTEDDSLLVAYWFNGENAPVFINVYNKTASPLYVDWARSSIITGDVAASYKDKIVSISDGSQPHDSYSNTTIIINDGVVTTDSYGHISESVSFIPPRSRKTFTTYALSNFNYDNLGDKFFKKAKLPDKYGIPADIKLLEFSENNTPLRFRSYLTFYNQYDKPFSMEHEFYISRLIKTKDLPPKSATNDFIGRGDLFYIEKVSKNKGFGEVLLGTTLLVGVVALDVALSSDYYD